MRIKLIAVGRRPPGWVVDGYKDYARRMPRECSLCVQEIPLGRRRKGVSIDRVLEEEGQRMMDALGGEALIVALDERGTEWSTAELARRLEGWRSAGGDVALLIGGPDGLAPRCRQRADQLWSLSRLTLPHALVRIVVAEQLYRAWSLLQGHPYHRA